MDPGKRDALDHAVHGCCWPGSRAAVRKPDGAGPLTTTAKGEQVRSLVRKGR
jgi:hypothetical protein